MRPTSHKGHTQLLVFFFPHLTMITVFTPAQTNCINGLTGLKVQVWKDLLLSDPWYRLLMRMHLYDGPHQMRVSNSVHDFLSTGQWRNFWELFTFDCFVDFWFVHMSHRTWLVECPVNLKKEVVVIVFDCVGVRDLNLMLLKGLIKVKI